MAKPAYFVWNEDHGERPEAPNIHTCWDEEDAAKEYAEKNWSDWDNPREADVTVQEFGKDPITFTVTSEPTWYFRAYRKKAANG